MKLPAWLGTVTLLLAVVVLAAERPAHAAFGISSISGATQVLIGPPPPHVRPGGNQQLPFPVAPDYWPIVFHEVLGGTIQPGTPDPDDPTRHPLAPSGLYVDHDGSNVTTSPILSGNIVNPLLMPTLIPVGTAFNSYLFHFDPAGDPIFGGNYDSTISFDQPVIGVQLFSNGFDLQKPAGTPYYGTLELGDQQVNLITGQPLTYYPGDANPNAPGLTYQPFGLNFRGVEEDFFQLIVVGNSVRLIGQVSGAEIDQVRILTSAVPEPASVLAWSIVVMIGCGAPFVTRQRQ